MTYWQRFKLFLGFPMPPRPEQENEALVTMREDRDCAVAAVATACKVSYEKAHKALWHRNLPWFFESPLFSNPLSVIQAIEKLGMSANIIGLTSILNGLPGPGEVVILVHNPKSPILSQHWAVWSGKAKDGRHKLAWGYTQDFVFKTDVEMIDLVTKGWPNCIIEVR